MRINYDDHNYIPERLPCKRRVNVNWTPSKKMECCRTVCPYKSDMEIATCYLRGGRIVRGGRFN